MRALVCNEYGERFVELPQIDVVHGQPIALQQFRYREYRPNAHLVRFASGDGRATVNAKWLETALRGNFGLHQHRGRYLVVGFASGDIPAFAANIALLKEASINGVWWGTWAEKNPALQAKNMQELAQLITAGKLVPRISESYSMDEFEDAFAAITERRALGKVIIGMT